MYTTINFPSKKKLKEFVLSYNQKLGACKNDLTLPKPRGVGVYQPNNLFNTPTPTEGSCVVEGPHYPKPHTWYAKVVLQDGCIVKVT